MDISEKLINNKHYNNIFPVRIICIIVFFLLVTTAKIIGYMKNYNSNRIT